MRGMKCSFRAGDGTRQARVGEFSSRLKVYLREVSFWAQPLLMSRMRSTKLPRSVASNPAKARVNWLQYTWHYPMWPFIWTVVVAGFAFLVLRASLWFLFLLPPIALS